MYVNIVDVFAIPQLKTKSFTKSDHLSVLFNPYIKKFPFN